MSRLFVAANVLLCISLFPFCRSNLIGANLTTGKAQPLAFQLSKLFRQKNPTTGKIQLPATVPGVNGGAVCESVDVRRNPIFASLLPSDLKRVMEKLKRVDSAEGEVIFEEGGSSNHMYFISEGEMECYAKNKPKNIVKTLGSGDYVGELALFLGTPRALSVRSKTKATLWKLTKENFDSAVQDTDIEDETILSLLKRAYNDEEVWVKLPKITFQDGKTEASWTRPHSHSGRFQPYNPAEMLVKNLDSAAVQTLESGKLYKQALQGKNAKRVLVIQDIKAPPATVFGQILDYSNYSKKVPQTFESEIYKTQTRGNIVTNFARLKTGMRGFSMEFFVKSEYHRDHNSIVWCLDYDKLSEIDEACGYWHAQPHPSSENKTRLYYSVDMSLGPKISGMIGNYVNKKAATDAMGWVKKYSEREAK
mmetsp:Transcript_27914/g.31921  ORF Transcript_27914/g.31921 Transcript_27914/m.31921 type:complete len:421 (-) Transcript_27914:117-1379(-)|eukprot:CAMPEP_0194145430 /NCGR_PEP_ID=MMETSP0152-20130528/17424_1 /TAXON_ID=1049557 /ORGANISM="Thalassiothrix antarctica, Strain L6-D1" /LENGTH=420 /DNA_ID=CAMNT_0038845669 /DNA_START=87 /DNA_END=1349 /DNA_ORIENTATION=-